MNRPAPDRVARKQLSDDTLVVFLSDAHIGGPTGSDIFESTAELTALLRDLSRHQGPVELKPAERRLPWIERVAIAGRMPPQPPGNAEPRVVARQVAMRRPAPREGGPR